MSGSIPSVPLAAGYAPRLDTGLAAQPTSASPSGAIGATPRVIDSIMLSEEAERYLVAAQLFSLQFRSRAEPASQSAANSQGSASSAQIAVSGAASETLSTTVFNGETTYNAVIDGPASGNGVLDIAAFDSGANSQLFTQVNVGNGNDTVNAVSNAMTNIDMGNGNDTVNVATTGVEGIALVHLGSGNDIANLNGAGVVAGGTGTDVINFKDDGGFWGAVGFGGAGNTTINGTGTGTLAGGGTGSTTINNISDIWLGMLDTGATTVNLPNAPYSHVVMVAGFGSATINLSDPASGISTATGSDLGQGCPTYCLDDQVMPTGKADQNGNFSGDGDVVGYQDVLPSEGQAGYGLAHARLDFRGITADQVTSSLQGSTLTLTVTATGETTTLNNYQPGRVTFTFCDDKSEFYTASRQPPNLAQTDLSSA